MRSRCRSALDGMLETVPHAVGVNNHQGSRATSDPALMGELMPALHARGLFFIDSRTTASTVAYDAAERANVPAASRKVFLDDTPERAAILAQLDLAAKDAMRDGSAIAIGHPHPATIAALSEAVPQLAGARHSIWCSRPTWCTKLRGRRRSSTVSFASPTWPAKAFACHFVQGFATRTKICPSVLFLPRNCRRYSPLRCPANAGRLAGRERNPCPTGSERQLRLTPA